MNCCAVVVAAGAGVRAGDGEAKQWRLLGGKPLLRWSVEALRAAGADPLVIVVPVGADERVAAALGGLTGWRSVVGGASRAQSVRRGLAALEPSDDAIVLIHDAARPFVSAKHVAAVLDALAQGADGAAPALAISDTLKRRRPGATVSTVDRTDLWRVQTPQAFRLATLRAAYGACADDFDPSDDCALIERSGGTLVLTPGDPMLMKVTFAEDFVMAERLAGAARVTCVGQGFDVHAFGPGAVVWLCGVEIAHTASLVGHSDADVGLHALTDAILGAIGEGDIGDHFPPSDARWKGAASSLFLEYAVALAAARGGRIVNADVTLICEAPKIKPHRLVMRSRIAELLGISAARVSVKATTTEGLGFTGRSEGLAAQAVATVELPV